ncbi:unnamed protein product [Rangifer tarandus platyrhynchus]|uniref:Uncharacterized protein n=2 Tax=Rangifer tarandus platyrhynchus TaxID=3082113 RepID=A0AC59ZJZ6_RANTA|nr:unnamed protein product [Rangifer tarandus platyrhynchus]
MLGFLPRLWPQGPALVLCTIMAVAASLPGPRSTAGLLATCRQGDEELRTPARCHWVTQTVVWALYGRWAWPCLAPKSHWGPSGGVLLHFTDPQGSMISDTQPESTHCHKHNELIQESTEGAKRACWFRGNHSCSWSTHIIGGLPAHPAILHSPAALPLPVPSPAALGRASQSPS